MTNQRSLVHCSDVGCRTTSVAVAAFGTETMEHYANMARVELAAFDAAVTDWELRRGFERL